MNKVFKLLRSTVETQNAWLSRHKREPSVMEATIPLWVAVRGAAACGGMRNAACVDVRCFLLVRDYGTIGLPNLP
jgi:hypothetical protein